MRWLLIVAFLVTACSSGQSYVQYQGVSESEWVEERDLPERPDSDDIPEEHDWVMPIMEGEEAPEDGILLSPEKAARAAKWMNGYEDLLTLYDIDRQIWGQHRIIYEETIGDANNEIKRVSHSWWDDNKAMIGTVAGFAIGTATTLGIVYLAE